MERVFLDADVILDFLAKRQPHDTYAAEVFNLADKGKIRICVSSLTFSHTYYHLAKNLGREKGKDVLRSLKTLVQILAVSDGIIDLSLASDFHDYEDAIQYFTAIENDCKVILTRNIKDYVLAQIPVMTPETFVK